MGSMAGGDQPKVLKALEFLNLIESNGKPREFFERLRDAKDEESEVKRTWADIVETAYPFMFGEFSLGTATQAQIEEKFKEEFKIQGDTIRKAVAFFLALCRNAGIPLSTYVKQTRVGGRRPGTRRANTKGANKANAGREKSVITRYVDEPDDDEDEVRGRRDLHPAIQAWIDELPPRDSTWSESDFIEWLSLLEASIRRAYKLPKKAQP
jgi:hypothetical protein